MLGADDVDQAVAVGEVDGVFAGGEKPDGAFGVQVVYGVIEQVAAVFALFNFYNAVQVDLYQAGCPKAIYHYAFVNYPGAVMQQKAHNDRNNDNTHTYQGQDVGLVVLVGKKIKGISGKAAGGQHQPYGYRDPFPAQVLLFGEDRFIVHVANLKMW